MKRRFILLFLSTLFSAHFIHAQDFVWGDANYKANYTQNAYPDYSCLSNNSNNGGATRFINGNLTFSEFDPAGLQLTAGSRSIEETGMSYFDLYFVEPTQTYCINMRNWVLGPDTDSNYYHVNCSRGNTKLRIRAKANVPTTMEVALGYTSYYHYPTNDYPPYTGKSSYEDGLRKTINLTTVMADYEIDFSDWANRSKVNLHGLYFANASVTIEEISIVSDSSLFSNRIKGNIYNDLNSDCSKQGGENGLAKVLVTATDGTNVYVDYTDSNGDYDILVKSGNFSYTVSPLLNEKTQGTFANQCPSSHSVTTNGSGNVFCCSDFAFKVNRCAKLSVEVNSDRRRRCFRSNTIVSYANYGNVPAASTVVKVVYPEFVKPISSIPAWTSQIGDTLIYKFGTLTAGGRGSIVLVDSVICGREDIRGLGQCTKAFISPKYQCLPDEPAWDKSSVRVMPYCENGVARFVVQNVGQDMAGSSAYRLYSNDTLIFQSTFQLISGNTFQIRYPANGAVMRLEADQRPGHPGRSQPRAFVEGCGTTGVQTTAFVPESRVLSVPQDDFDEEVASSCLTIVDSYDPNDKAAVPIGITDNHLIKAGEQIKYTIRFQNTGSDVAYKVVVVDTLDLNIDAATFKESSSSHPYVLSLTTSEDEKRILTYTFNDITLKDSTTSEPESHGFISFYINIKEGLADGHTIHNKAHIFFDYNSAIVTNLVDHTIGTYVPTDLTKGNSVQVITGLFDDQARNISQRVTLYPNPASGIVQVKLDQQISSGQLMILDLSGHEVWSGILSGEITSISLSGLSAGMYMYKVVSNGEYVGVGKLLVK